MRDKPKVLSEADALSCPFCGNQPTIEPWHGGGPRKRLIACQHDDCDVSPMVTGSTRGQALARWNRRTHNARALAALGGSDG